jgi:fluoride exporter
VSRHALGFVLVFIRGGLGSMLRHASNQASAAILGPDFPYGTMFVNIVGSLAIGLIAGWFGRHGGGGQMLPLFLTTGILGGFTTFSAFPSTQHCFGNAGR